MGALIPAKHRPLTPASLGVFLNPKAQGDMRCLGSAVSRALALGLCTVIAWLGKESLGKSSAGHWDT